MLLALYVRGVRYDAVDWAYLHTLRRVEVAYTFGTFVWSDDVNILMLRKRAIRALRFTYIAIDALLIDH